MKQKGLLCICLLLISIIAIDFGEAQWNGFYSPYSEYYPYGYATSAYIYNNYMPNGFFPGSYNYQYQYNPFPFNYNFNTPYLINYTSPFNHYPFYIAGLSQYSSPHDQTLAQNAWGWKTGFVPGLNIWYSEPIGPWSFGNHLF